MKELFFELKAWIKETEDIDVFVDESYYEKNNVALEERLCNGTAGNDGDITIYLDDAHAPDWSMSVSLLIHEIGHVLLFQDDRHNHSEKSAWIRGVEFVPEKFRHDNLKDHICTCLSTYDYKNFGWVYRLF